MRAEVGSSTIRLDLLPFLLSLQSYRRKIRVSWCCFEPCQSKEREKKPPNTPSSHLPPLMCHPVATPGLPQCLAGLWLGTKPLPATSRALGIWSGWHPRAGWGGQVPNPEPRGAKPLHQVHHRGSKTKCGEVLALLQMFFFLLPTPKMEEWDGTGKLESKLLIKAGSKQHLHPPPVLPKYKQLRDPIEFGVGGREAAIARDAERHIQAQERRWAAAFAQLLSWLFITPKPC